MSRFMFSGVDAIVVSPLDDRVEGTASPTRTGAPTRPVPPPSIPRPDHRTIRPTRRTTTSHTWIRPYAPPSDHSAARPTRTATPTRPPTRPSGPPHDRRASDPRVGTVLQNKISRTRVMVLEHNDLKVKTNKIYGSKT